MEKKSFNIIIFFLAIALSLPLFAERIASFSRIEPRKFRRGDPWRSMVSDRNLLKLTRPAIWAMPIPMKDSRADTVKVLCIRVEFKPDNTRRTTGNGTFDLRPRSQAEHPFDPPPHNKKYFDSHMQALKNYYLAVSDSQLVIEWDIFPEDETLAYRLPDSMGYYGELGWMGGDILDRMQIFFKDSWEFAIASGDFNPANWDAYIVFHAGSDWQNDVASLYPLYAEIWPDIFIPSPDDLPTGYLKLDFTIGGVITDGIIMPEQAWQDGQIVCLNGALAHEFGHQLGLVDLYSTRNFITQVGDFSLMDNGFAVGAQIAFEGENKFYDVYGAYPAYPSAWERAYLGWEIPKQINFDTNAVAIQACALPKNTGTTIVKIPINSYEYYLIENRQYDFRDSLNRHYGFPDSIGFRMLTRDSITGVVLGALSKDGVNLTSARDFLLPGEGILVWHIDESVAYADVDGNGINNFEDNTLQWDVHKKFIALEEADGYADLGVIVTYGEREDYFYYPNNTRFGPRTNPSTCGNDGGSTGIDVTINGYGFLPVMQVNVGLNRGVPTPNVITTIYPLYAPLACADLDEDGVEEIITEGYFYYSGSYRGVVLIWKNDGSKFILNSYMAQGIEFDGSNITVPYPVCAMANANRITLPAVGDITGDGLPEIVGFDTDGKLHAWNPRSINASGLMNEVLGFPITLDTTAQRPVSLWDINNDGALEIIAYSGEKWFLVDGNGNLLVTGNARGEITGIAPSENALYVLARRNFAKLIKFDYSGNWLMDIQMDRGDVSYLARADLDGDGIKHELTCVSRSGKIYAFQDPPFALMDNFPATVMGDTSLASPITIDVDGDRIIEIISTGRAGVHCYKPSGFARENTPYKIYNALTSPVFTGEIAIFPTDSGIVPAIDLSGKSPEYFPLSGAPSNAMPCIFRDSLGYGLALGSTNGSLFIWRNMFDDISGGAWRMWGADAQHSFLQPAQGGTPTQSAGLSIKSFYCYPNPAERKTNFRWEISKNAVVDIIIMDAVGNIIAKLDCDGAGGTPIEKEWAIGKVGSGVYWAHLRAKTSTDEKSKIIKVAIVK